jgi:hypothetical protein
VLIKNRKGQGVVEMVFSIGLLALLLTGAVVLIVTSLGAKGKGIDRKAATVVGERVIEGLINEQKNDSASFWSSIGTNRSDTIDGYSYTVEFTPVTSGGSCDNADSCVNAKIIISWPGSNDVITLSRFLAKYE